MADEIIVIEDPATGDVVIQNGVAITPAQIGALPNTPAAFGAAWMAWVDTLPTTPEAAGVGNPYNAGGGLVLRAVASS